MKDSHEQAGSRRGFGTVDHIHTLTRVIEVSREYKMPLCLTFIVLKRAFDTVKTEAGQDFTSTRKSLSREERCPAGRYHFTQSFIAALENKVRHLEWEDLQVKVDGR
uniref:Reverse transcriptase domain-containing protein n=1 Tax=Haemonchus contortus TaxID=6289 RepID=A0A7I4Y226_HAECO